MSLKNRYLLLSFILLVVNFSFGQKKTEKSIAEYNLGNKYFNEFSYRIAINHFLKAYKIDTVSVETKSMLAQSYYRMRDFKDAEVWANKLVYSGYSMSENEMYYYIEILASNRHYHEAEYWYNEYIKFDNCSKYRLKRLEGFLHETNYSNIGVNFWINPISINSAQSDFAPMYYKDGIVFLSGRRPNIDVKKMFKNDGINYLNLYYTKKIGGDEYSEPVLFNKKVKSRYNEGPVAFYDNYTKIIFTQNSIEKRKLFGKKASKTKDGSTVLKLYIADCKSDTIANIHPFKYNSDEYSSAHPTVSEDGNRLVFSSNRPGTIGGSDLYMCHRINGQWSEPVNMGDEINTEGKELFPYLSGNVLYFTSDGHQGLGGLDIFLTILINDKPTEIINPGYQINSPKDDFSLITRDGHSGYFASNRGNALNDEIYFGEYHAPPLPLTVDVVVVDDSTQSLLKKSDVDISDTVFHDNLIAYNVVGDSIYQYRPEKSSQYRIIVNHIGYFAKDTIINTADIASGKLNWVVFLSPIKANQTFALNNIYYDFDKATLRDSSKIELNRVVKWLEGNESVRIEIHSHTDSWGSESYNMNLSEQRSESIVNYLVESGIDKDRLVPKGFGESQPIVYCPIPKNCSKQDHQKNRRTELMIIDK